MAFIDLVSERLPNLNEEELEIIQECFKEITKKGKKGGRTRYHVFLESNKAVGKSHAESVEQWQGMTKEEKSEIKMDPDAEMVIKKKSKKGSKDTNKYKEFTAD